MICLWGIPLYFIVQDTSFPWILKFTCFPTFILWWDEYTAHGYNLPAISSPRCLLTCCFYAAEAAPLWFNSTLTNNTDITERAWWLLPGQDPRWKAQLLAGGVSLDEFTSLPGSWKWVKSSVWCQWDPALSSMKETNAEGFCDGRVSVASCVSTGVSTFFSGDVRISLHNPASSSLIRGWEGFSRILGSKGNGKWMLTFRGPAA